MEAELGSVVRELRQGKGLSLSKLADAVGVDKAYLSRIENGVVRPSFRVMTAIADELGASRLDMLVQAGYLHIGNPEEYELVKRLLDSGVLDFDI